MSLSHLNQFETFNCAECNKELRQITQKHLNVCSGLTVEEYKKKHPNALIRTKWHSEKIKMCNSKNKLGDNNPMKNETHFKKMLENQLIAVQNEEYRKRVSERQKLKNNNPGFGQIWKGRKKSKDSIEKQRKTQIEQRRRKGLSNKFRPNFSELACTLFDKISSLCNIHIQHGLNGGEYNIVELGFWVDGYDKENNIVFEFDEARHFNNDGSLKEKDILRQRSIEQYLQCKFIRLNESHIDSMRDIVDSLIEISKLNGNSKISYH